jgi:hypothetical protein
MVKELLLALLLLFLIIKTKNPRLSPGAVVLEVLVLTCRVFAKVLPTPYAMAWLAHCAAGFGGH